MFDKEDVKAEEQAIWDDIEKNGRLGLEQEKMLYTIALRQDELGRKPTNMLESKIKGSELYQPMLDREYLTYEVFDNLGNPDHRIASLYVTLKGMRYCMLLSDELEKQMDVNPAGVKWDQVDNLV